MQYLSDYLQKITQEGKHWMDYQIIMDKVKNYEKKYGIKIQILVEYILKSSCTFPNLIVIA